MQHHIMLSYCRQNNIVAAILLKLLTLHIHIVVCMCYNVGIFEIVEDKFIASCQFHKSQICVILLRHALLSGNPSKKNKDMLQYFNVNTR